MELVALGEGSGEGWVLEVPHEGSGVEETDGGYADGMGRDRGQETSLLEKVERAKMRRAITGFEKDEEGHWRALLECGHKQHVRHDPPWMMREWVTTEEGRASRLGSVLECKKCDEDAKGVIQR